MIVSDILNDTIVPNKPNVDDTINAVAENKAINRIDTCPSSIEFRTSIHFSCATELTTDMFFAVNMLLTDCIIADELRGVVSVMFDNHQPKVAIYSSVRVLKMEVVLFDNFDHHQKISLRTVSFFGWSAIPIETRPAFPGIPKASDRSKVFK